MELVWRTGIQAGRAAAMCSKPYWENPNRVFVAFAVRGLCYSPTRSTLAAAGTAGVILREGDELWERMPLGGGSSGPARALAFSLDGNLLAAATGIDPARQTIHLWDVQTGRELRSMRGGAIDALAFTLDGSILAVTDAHGVSLWNVASGAFVQTLPTPGAAHALAFSSDGATLAAASGTVVWFWNVAGWSKKTRQMDRPRGRRLPRLHLQRQDARLRNHRWIRAAMGSRRRKRVWRLRAPRRGGQRHRLHAQ